jgi:surface antigen
MRKRTRTAIGSMAAALVLMSLPAAAHAEAYWQCVPFARMISGIQLFGDAWTWWGGAQGKYQTGYKPVSGAVLVFRPTGKMKLGHVAVVSQVLTDRLVQVSHANWSQINGARGQVENDVVIADVSEQGDWSVVKVWYDPIGDLGTTTYPTYGFIYQDNTAKTIASAVRGVQGAMGVVANAVPNAVTASGQVVNSVVDAADSFGSLIQKSLSGK